MKPTTQNKQSKYRYINILTNHKNKIKQYSKQRGIRTHKTKQTKTKQNKQTNNKN